ncbi:MAG: sugar porter family MFS transporter, partial [Burkholderiales bacterium]|nr:sugar porter family MFS transporter [Burkholderiales bacterium]
TGWLSHQFGRKKVLVLASIIFTGSIIFTLIAHSFGVFLLGRFITGLGVGIASFVAPLYLSEISPKKIRGGVIAMYQLMITIGIFLMFVSNALLSFTGSWRIMLAILLIPSIIMLLGTLTLPESPRWVALKGDIDRALIILHKVRTTPEEIEFEIKEIKDTISNKVSLLKLLSNGYFLKVALLGVFLQFLQQFSGMNAFMYYSEKIFATAGFTNPAIGTVIVGLVNVLTTFIAIKFVDRIGRKPILYFGLTILVASCLVVGYLFNLQSTSVAILNQAQQYTLVIFCLLFIFGFAVSLGPIIWIICSEIFPLEARDIGITITTMGNWIFNTIIGTYTLVWFESIGVGQTFYMFGGVCLFGFVLVKVFTPETKGISLEDLEMNLKDGKKLRDIGN